MKSKFNCPNCSKPQNLKYLFLAHHPMKWQCPDCKIEINTKKLSLIVSVLSTLSFYLSCFIPLIYLKWNFIHSLLTGIIIGLITYLFTHLLYNHSKSGLIKNYRNR